MEGNSSHLSHIYIYIFKPTFVVYIARRPWPRPAQVSYCSYHQLPCNLFTLIKRVEEVQQVKEEREIPPFSGKFSR